MNNNNSNNNTNHNNDNDNNSTTSPSSPTTSTTTTSTTKDTNIKVLGHAVLQRENYTGHELLSIQGKLLAKIPEKRFYWYLRKGLATQIDEKTIQLNFEAKGDGNSGDAFYMSEQVNQCVCCGDQSHYTRHHVVPYEYRRCFPVHLKASNSHDIVLLCSECHEVYETEAMKFKRQICEKYNVNINGCGKERDKSILKAKSHANAILHHRDQIPKQRVDILFEQLQQLIWERNLLEREEMNLEEEEADETTIILSDNVLRRIIDLDEWIGLDSYVTHGEGVVRSLLEGVDPSDETEILHRLDAFAIEWRCHFIDIMNPQFINEHWDPRRSMKKK